jgi:dipeptidyl aminopeptidase/acylaminoacyl peptidase
VSSFDVSKTGLAFVAKDPTLNQATTTKSDLYYVPLSTFQEPVAPKAKVIATPGMQGASTSPVFSQNGTKLVFLRQKDISYESDKWRIFLVEMAKSTTATEFYTTADGVGAWDRWPGGFVWSTDDSELYVFAEEQARIKVFSMPSDPAKAKALPSPIFKEGAVQSVFLLNSGSGDQLLVSSSSLIDNSIFSIVDPAQAAASNATQGVKLLSANLDNGAKYGLSRSQYFETYWKGAGDYMVHSWIIKPSFFKEGVTYPMAFVIHGGPQGSWEDSWSYRWNLVSPQ